MRLPFGLSLVRTKTLSPVDGRGGWWPIIRESATGAWQTNLEVSIEDSLQYWPVFRCVSLIPSDIAKLGLRLVEKSQDGIWTEVESPAFSPVLRKPNHFQNRIQFIENWVQSKLTRGNTYVLKVRDERQVVVALYVLDPNRVKPLVADNGDVFYQLMRDQLAEVESDIAAVPASEIIHDRWNALYHPLVGLSPIYAAAMNALAGKKIVENSARFFANGAQPSGILTAPGSIGDETAARLKAHWDDNYSGAKAGKVAVLGDGLKYEKMTMSSTDAQLVEQLKWTAESICGVFGVPAYMVITSNVPTYNNVEALHVQYYKQCLQILIESIELCLDEGLGLDKRIDGRILGTEFDISDLLRMDTSTQFDVLEKAKSLLTLDERRKRVNYGKIAGGGTVYLQQQDHSIEAIAARDQALIANGGQEPTALPAPADDDSDDDIEEEAQRFYAAALDHIERGFHAAT